MSSYSRPHGSSATDGAQIPDPPGIVISTLVNASPRRNPGSKFPTTYVRHDYGTRDNLWTVSFLCERRIDLCRLGSLPRHTVRAGTPVSNVSALAPPSAFGHRGLVRACDDRGRSSARRRSTPHRLSPGHVWVRVSGPQLLRRRRISECRDRLLSYDGPHILVRAVRKIIWIAIDRAGATATQCAFSLCSLAYSSLLLGAKVSTQLFTSVFRRFIVKQARGGAFEIWRCSGHHPPPTEANSEWLGEVAPRAGVPRKISVIGALLNSRVGTSRHRSVDTAAVLPSVPAKRHAGLQI